MSTIEYRNIDTLKKLDNNPRVINSKDLRLLSESIKNNPDYFNARPIILSNRTGELVIIAGNQRYEASILAGLKQVPTFLIEGLSEDKEKEIVVRDNVSSGEWDLDLLIDDYAISLDLDSIGLDMSFFNADKKAKKEKASPKENEDVNDFYQSMLKDCIYDSSNELEIPNLRIDRQAGKLELPFAPYGADSRLRKDVTTYHFYVDDYRFEAIWKDPSKIINSNIKSIVEPNLSLFDTTPIAYGLHQIYKKRWISRYFQECGILVYADLNVSSKFKECNKLGIPSGYNAFFTRGYSDREEYLKQEIEVAKEISGLDIPNLIVYGGGSNIRKICIDNSLVYVEQFMNNKK